MIVFPSMLFEAAAQAGMKHPEEDDFKPEDFPHFNVFCNVQLCRPVRWGEHWENAKIIAAIPESELKTLMLQDLLDKGLVFSS